MTAHRPVPRATRIRRLDPAGTSKPGAVGERKCEDRVVQRKGAMQGSEAHSSASVLETTGTGPDVISDFYLRKSLIINSEFWRFPLFAVNRKVFGLLLASALICLH